MTVPVATPKRVAAVGSGALLIAVPLLSLPFLLRQGPFIQVFLPMWGSVACLADLLTAYLLFGQFRGTRVPAQAALATPCGTGGRPRSGAPWAKDKDHWHRPSISHTQSA